jgi:branched-chain amino acid transport system substrate-binding protein
MEGIGVDAYEAAKLAFADLGNMAGGFAIEYVALDSGIAANNGGWDPGVESANANQAIADADCMAYMGTYNSGAAKISIPIMNEAGMAMISFANTYSGLTKDVPGIEEGEPDVYYPTGKRNYARVIAADDIQGALGARWAVESKSVGSAYVLDDQSLYGHGVAQVFNDTLLEIGAEVLGFEGYDPKAPDYQALMTKIADAAPDPSMSGPPSRTIPRRSCSTCVASCRPTRSSSSARTGCSPRRSLTARVTHPTARS